MKNPSFALMKISTICIVLLVLSQISVSFSEQTQTQENKQLDNEMFAKIRKNLVNIIEEENFSNDEIYRMRISYYGAEAIEYLIEIAKHDKNEDVRWNAAQEIRNSEYNYLGFDLFIELVNDENKSVRWQALNALGQIGDKRATPILLKAMHDENYEVRYDAAGALYDIEDKSATPELLKILRNGTDEDRSLACYALAGIKDPAAVPEVIKALKDKNEEVRSDAAWVLRETKDPSSVPALIEALIDESKDVRERVREALAEIGNKSAILYLIKFCEIGKCDSWGKDAAKLILDNKKKTRKFVIDALKHADDGIRKKAIWLIGKMREKSAIPTLLELLKDDKTEIKLQVIATLNVLNDKSVVPTLIKSLKDDEVTVRVAATKALRKFGDKSAIPAIMDLLNRKNPKITKAAISALGGLKAEEAVDDIIEFIDSTDEKLKISAIVSLGLIGDEKAVPYIVKELKNESVNIRITAVRALAKIGSKSAFTALMDVVNDESTKVRNSLIYSLEDSGVDAVSILIQMFDDRDEDIIEDAVWTINRIGYKAIPGLIKALRNENYNIRINALKTLAEYEDYSAETELVRLLNDEYVEIRILAAKALWNAGSESAIEPLITALKDKNEMVRANSARALGYIADVPDVTELIKILQDKEAIVREYAARALGRIQNKTAVPALIALLGDENVKVRYEAVNALGEIADPQAAPALTKSLKDEGVVERYSSNCPFPYDINFYIRSEAARVLSLIGDKTVVPEIIELLEDKVINVKKETIEALARLGDKRALEPLAELILDKSYEISRAAVDALENFESDAIPIFLKTVKTSNYVAKHYVTEALFELCDHSVVPVLCKSFDNDSFTSTTIKMLIKYGDKEAVPYLIRALNVIYFRTSAAAALARIKDERAIAPLQKLYENSKYEEEKVLLAESLYNLDVPDKKVKLDFIVKTLLRYKEIDENEDFYQRYYGDFKDLIETAYESVCRIKNKRTTSILTKLSQDETFFKKRDIIKELRNRLDKTTFKELYEKQWAGRYENLDKDMRSIEELIEEAINNLDDKEIYRGKTQSTRFYIVRESAIRFLGRLKVKSAVPKLIESLDEIYEHWIGFTVHALGEIGEKSAIDPLQKLFNETKDKLLKVYIATALVKLGSENNDDMFNFVVKALESKKYGIPQGAAVALGEIGDKSAIPALIKALSTKDDWVRKSFINALCKIGDESALPALKKLLAEEPLRKNRQNIKDIIEEIENNKNSK